MRGWQEKSKKTKTRRQGAGKFEYCLHVVNESLKKGIDVIFITTDASWVKYVVGEKGFKWVSEHPIEF
jgi:KaiC/GvpD/RAD55 family RecA-like ATPase